MRGNSFFLLFLTLALLVIWGTTFAQVVSPMQTGHYTPATMGVRDMSNPIPGFFPIWYNLYATSDTYVDLDGNEVTNLNQVFPNLNLDIGYEVKAFATIPMFFWASNKISALGGANYMGGLAFNYVSVDASVNTSRYWAIADTTINRSTDGGLSGFSDMTFVPLGLSWGLGNMDITTLYLIAAPTGKFEVDGDENLGMGFMTHMFQGFGYFYPVEDHSTAIMLGMTYELNGEMKDTDFNPGNRFSLEYGFSQYLSSRFEVAVQGGHNWQITDDSGSDVSWDPSKHDQKSTLAFYGAYWPWEGKLLTTLKYGFDYGAKGRGLTNYWMFNILFIPGILTGN